MGTIVKVPFHGDELLAQQDEAGVWVVFKRVCDALSLGYASQTQKVKDKPWATVTTIVTVAEDGKSRKMMALHLDSLPMWLATIDAGRVAPEVRAKIERYQVECARVLRDHFFGATTPTPPPSAPSEMPPWVKAIFDRVTALEARLLAPTSVDAMGGQIGQANAAHICQMLRTYAGLMGVDKDDAASWRTRGEDELRSQLGFQRSKGAAWSRLPVSFYSRALMKLEEMLSRARKTNVARVELRQLPLHQG